MDQRTATEIIEDVNRLEARSQRALRSFWTLPLWWGAVALVGIPFVLLTGYPGEARFGPPWPATVDWISTLTFVRHRLDQYWIVALPAAVAGSVLLYRSRRVRPRGPRLSLWYLPFWVAVALFVPIGLMAAEEWQVPPNGLAGWFPLVAIASLVAGWLGKLRLLVTASIALLGFTLWWQSCGLGPWFLCGLSPQFLLLPTAFAAVYLITAAGLFLQQRGRP